MAETRERGKGGEMDALTDERNDARVMDVCGARVSVGNGIGIRGERAIADALERNAKSTRLTPSSMFQAKARRSFMWSCTRNTKQATDGAL